VVVLLLVPVPSWPPFSRLLALPKKLPRSKRFQYGTLVGKQQQQHPKSCPFKMLTQEQQKTQYFKDHALLTGMDHLL
jgi:hypothetical protein